MTEADTAAECAKLRQALKETEKAAEESRRRAAEHWEALQMLRSRPLTEALVTLYARNVELVDIATRAKEVLRSCEVQVEYFRGLADTMMREAERMGHQYDALAASVRQHNYDLADQLGLL